jgi:hypothetical protein
VRLDTAWRADRPMSGRRTRRSSVDRQAIDPERIPARRLLCIASHAE